jgi:hypothetical protein
VQGHIYQEWFFYYYKNQFFLINVFKLFKIT